MNAPKTPFALLPGPYLNVELIKDRSSIFSTMRTSNGCWTCKLRRKKCDEHQPVCYACDALNITCHNDQDNKPEWMDNGTRQQNMAEQVKRGTKRQPRPRHGGTSVSTESVDNSSARSTASQPETGQISSLSGSPSIVENDSPENDLEARSLNLWRNLDSTSCHGPSQNLILSHSDIQLLAFYLETLLPFHFPFYRPSHLQGGRSWILELMTGPAVRHTVMCYSSYFLALTREIAVGRDEAWERVLVKTGDTFEVLRQALGVIHSSSVGERLHGAVRILASIMQLHRFEISVLSFRNWSSHLSAALALFTQILDTTAITSGSVSTFNLVMSKLGPSAASSWSTLNLRCPSAEQAAFRFSSTLLVFDDVIASTMLQTKPQLYDYHVDLLGSQCDDARPPIDVEAVLGMNNTVLRQLGEISALAAWKEECKTLGSLDLMELVQHASVIKEVLLNQMTRFASDQATIPQQASLLNVNAAPAFPRSPIGRVWIHAALIYLSVVVSGWQPGNVDVRNNVHQIIDLLSTKVSPTLLPTMVWPFSIAGCMAEIAQECQFRDLVARLQPPSIFGTVHKALEVMERVWRTRNADHSFASCFQLDDDLILLI